MPPFIDIHTHKLPQTVASNTTAIHNFLQADFSKLEEKTGGKLASVGLHPYYLTKENAKSDFESLTQLIDYQNVVAIGECGLDRLRGEALDFQTTIFEQQIKLAVSVQKPIIIHCVRAFSEVIAVKKRLQPTVPLIIHGFAKNEAVLMDLLKHDFYISIGAAILRGGISFKNAIKQIPQNRLFIETDDAVEPIEAIYQAVAEACGVSISNLKSIVYENFKIVFNSSVSDFFVIQKESLLYTNLEDSD